MERQNREKAQEIIGGGCDRQNCYECGGSLSVAEGCVEFKHLKEMAEYKDKRVKSCFTLISKLIKDGVLTKDNPEHIMVEQMMELYNNLKI